MSLNRNSVSNLDLAYQAESSLGQQSYQNSTNPAQSNVIPRNFNQQLLNQDSGCQSDAIFSNLSGQQVNKEGFHNNMVPFFRGQVKQNVSDNTYNTRLETFTGIGEGIRPQKKEVKSFFDVSKNMTYPNGSPSYTTNPRIVGRYIPSSKRQGEKPFQDVRVGPGLAKGYTSTPSGGYTQSNTRDYIIPKNVDELRVLTNPKVSYEGRIVNGLKSGQRGLVSKPRKNRPETYYASDPERGNLSAAIKSATMRKKFCMKRTNKQNQRSYYGGLGSGEISKPKKESAVRKSTKNNYMNPTPRNAFRPDAWRSNEDADAEGVGDYGRQSIENRPNERDLTQSREHRNNVTTTVKKLITPITDLFRRTRKENFVGNMRPDGNMSAAMPSKQTVYDPTDIARTTIKETNIHNEHDGFLQGGELKGIAYDPDDIARTTIKEINIHNKAPYINMNPQQPRSIRVYDPEDIAKTTLKEVTIDNDHLGFVSRGESLNPGGYTTTNVSMKNTHKQFLTNYYYTGIADAEVGTGTGRGYLASNYKAKNTHKQFLSNYEYKGHAGDQVGKAMSYSDKYNARLNPNREEISKGRAPTQTSVKLGSGQDHVNITHRRIESDQINIREPAEDKVYDAPPQKNTCGLTTVKDKLPEDVQRDRLNAELLQPFKNNPYTQSLFSAV
jgi:hypothetical protein